MYKIFFIFLLFNHIAQGQLQTINWDSIKQLNKLDNRIDSILTIKQTYYVDSKDTEENFICFKFENYHKPLLYFSSSHNKGVIFRYDNGNFYKKNLVDSDYIFTGYRQTFDPQNSIFDTYFFLRLKELPFFNKGFYDTAVTTSIITENDITIISQLFLPNKDYKRILYLKDSRIFKIEIITANPDYVSTYSQLEFEFVRNKSFDEICAENKLGLNFPIQEYQTKKNKDSIRVLKSNDLAIINKGNLKIDSNSNKFYILDFWFMSCKPCIQLLPTIENISSQIDTNKIVLLGINPYDKNTEVLRFMKKHNINCDQINGQVNNLAYLDVDEFPTILIIDSKMNVVKKFVGYSDSKEREILKYLRRKKLLKLN